MKQFKKIDLYYRKSNGAINKIGYTDSFTNIEQAINSIKLILKNSGTFNAHERLIGEKVDFDRIFGRIDKSDL